MSLPKSVTYQTSLPHAHAHRGEASELHVQAVAVALPDGDDGGGAVLVRVSSSRSSGSVEFMLSPEDTARLARLLSVAGDESRMLGDEDP